MFIDIFSLVFMLSQYLSVMLIYLYFSNGLPLISWMWIQVSILIYTYKKIVEHNADM